MLKIARLWGNEISPSPGAWGLTVNQQVSVTRSKNHHAKLPEIKLLTSGGNYDEWETFWSSFYNNVDSRDNLEKSAKLTYLLQSLEGEPREMIKGLSHTDANYIIAGTALQDRYEDPVKQTKVLLQNFFNLPSPRHNAKELRSFLTEYHKVREHMRHVEDFDASSLTIRSVLIRKLSYQTFSEVCDHVKNHNFSLQDMDSTLQCIIGKLEHANLVLGTKQTSNQWELIHNKTKIKGEVTNAHFAQAIIKL